MVSVGIFNATSGCILPQLETDPDMKITEEEGSWFGESQSDLNLEQSFDTQEKLSLQLVLDSWQELLGHCVEAMSASYWAEKHA